MLLFFFFFFFNDPATTEIYTLSLHDALPISLGLARRGSGLVRADSRICPGHRRPRCGQPDRGNCHGSPAVAPRARPDRKSTRLNSSHSQISYAVFCLKKKKTQQRLAPRVIRG